MHRLPVHTLLKLYRSGDIKSIGVVMQTMKPLSGSPKSWVFELRDLIKSLPMSIG